MKSVTLSASLLFGIFLLGFSPTSAFGTWRSEIVTHLEGGGTGSIAVDAHGDPHIAFAFHGGSNQGLHYAVKSQGTWTLETVHGQQYTQVSPQSLVLDSEGNPHIAYLLGDRFLIYATKAMGTWATDTVYGYSKVGACPALELDADGNPHIIHVDFSIDSLIYTSKSGDVWNNENVDWRTRCGGLALDADGNPHFSYTTFSRPGNLKYATKSKGVWTIETVGPIGDFSESSLALDANGNPHIASTYSFFVGTISGLTYASKSGGGWTSDTLETSGNIIQDVSLKVDATDTPHITFEDISTLDLKYATRLGAMWTITSADTTGHVGAANSLALDNNGNPHISYVDVTNRNLKYTTKPCGGQGLPECASISGMVFSDINGNGVRDLGEGGLLNRFVRLEPNTSYSLTTATGSYEFDNLTPGSYTVSLVAQEGWTQTFPVAGTHQVDLLEGQPGSGFDFGDTPNELTSDLAIDLTVTFPWPLRSPCCDQSLTYLITYKNVGTLPAGTRIVLLLPPEVSYTPSAIAVPPNFTAGDPVVSFGGKQLTWRFMRPLAPNAVGYIWVEGLLKCSGGSEPTFVAHATIQAPQRNAMLPLKVTCSSDPNDKQVLPSGCGVAGLISREDSLTYRVRFQNNGTGPAFHVVIRDTLDDDLDPATVETVATSHPSVFERSGQALAWAFWGIVLPDSASDELGSQGYVKFKVKPRPEAATSAAIANRASIYFDLNEPVVTNATINTITEDPLPVAAFSASEDTIPEAETVDFNYTGGTEGASHMWVFGAGAVPESSTVESPADVQFTTPGFHSVLHFVTLGECQSEPAVHLLTVFDPLDVGTASRAQIYLEPVRPNPSDGLLSIGFGLPSHAMVRLSVWDIQGREVAVLANRAFGAGRHHLVWNGAMRGGIAPAGMYFVRYQALGRILSRRVVVLK